MPPIGGEPTNPSRSNRGARISPLPRKSGGAIGEGVLAKIIYLYEVQCPAWREYVASVCHNSHFKSQEERIVIAWNLLLLLLVVKRFLFFPEDTLSQRHLAREFRMRPHLERSETLAPTPTAENRSPMSAIKRAEELVRAGAFSRAAARSPGQRHGCPRTGGTPASNRGDLPPQFGAQYTQGCKHIVHNFKGYSLDPNTTCILNGVSTSSKHLQNARQHFRDRPEDVIVAADLENAFNSISR